MQAFHWSYKNGGTFRCNTNYILILFLVRFYCATVIQTLLGRHVVLLARTVRNNVQTPSLLWPFFIILPLETKMTSWFVLILQAHTQCVHYVYLGTFELTSLKCVIGTSGKHFSLSLGWIIKPYVAPWKRKLYCFFPTNRPGSFLAARHYACTVSTGLWQQSFRGAVIQPWSSTRSF